MANINITTIVDQILKPGKVTNEKAFQDALNQVLVAVIQKTGAPTAAFDLPVDIKNIKLNKTDIKKLKDQMAAEVAKIDTALEDSLGKTDRPTVALRKRQAAIRSLFEDLNNALEKIPTIKISPTTQKDMQRVLADPFEVHKITGERNGAKRVANLRAYAQYINDYKKEIQDIHRRASEGVNVVMGSGGTFQTIKAAKVSLPGFGAAAKVLNSPMAAVSKALDPVAMERYQKNIQEKSVAKDLREAQQSSNLSLKARKSARLANERAAAATQKAKDLSQAKIEKKAEERQSLYLSREAINRVGGKSRSALSNLTDSEQPTVARGLKLESEQIQRIRRGLESRMRESIDTNPARYQALEAAHARLGARLPEIQQGLRFVNSEMNGLAGFTNKAAIATQQFLKYAIGYGVGYKLLSGIGSLFSDTTGLDKALHAIQAISQASRSEMAVVEGAIKGVSEASQFSTAEIAQAAQVLAQAGVQINSLPSILSTVSKLASTTSADLKVSSEVLTSLSEAFDQTEPAQMAALADRLAQAVNVSKLTTEGLKTIVSLSASTAKLSGVSDTQLLASSAVLANKGIKDSTIATGLREMMVELFSPDAKLLTFLKSRYAKIGEGLMAESEIKAKYQNFTKAEDPIQAVLLELKRIGVSGVARNDFNRITETRAQNVLLPLMDSMDKRIENIAQISQSGAIDRGAATNMEAVSNALSGVESAAVSLTHEMLSGFFPTIVEGTRKFKSFLENTRQNVVQANGESSGGVPQSVMAGVIAGILTGVLSKVGLLKRGAAALGAGVLVGGGEIAAGTQGDKGKAISDVANVALTFAALWSMFKGIASKSADIGGLGVLIRSQWDKVGLAFNALKPLLLVNPWARLATVLVSIATVVGASKLFKGQGDPQARLKAANTQMADQQKKAEEHATAYAPFSTATKDGQAAIVEKARKDFAEARTKIAETLSMSVVPDNLLQEIIKLGTEGAEVDSPEQKAILARLGIVGKASREQVSTLTKEGQKLSASMATVSSKAKQNLDEIVVASTEINPLPVQESYLAIFDKLGEEKKRLSTTIDKVDLSNFDKVSSALAEVYQSVFEDAPNQMADGVRNGLALVTTALSNMDGMDNKAIENAALTVKSMTAKASTGTVQSLEDNIKQLEALKRQLEKDITSDPDHRTRQNRAGVVSDDEIAQPRTTRGGLSRPEVTGEEAQANRKALLGEVNQNLATQTQNLADRRKEEEHAKAQKLIDDAATKARTDKETALSGVTSAAGQAQYVGEQTFNGKVAFLEGELKKAQADQSIARERALQAELAATKQQQANTELATKVAVFEEMYNKAGKGDFNWSPSTLATDKAKAYTDTSSNQELLDNISTGSDELKAAFADLNKTYSATAITAPSDLAATLGGLDRQQQEKDLANQQRLTDAQLESASRRIQLAKSENTLDQQAVTLANEQYGLQLESINISRSLAALHHDDATVVEAQLKAKRQTVEDERKLLLEDAHRLTLEKEKATLGKQLRTANKAVEFAVDSGDMGGLGNLQNERDALAFKKLENELATMKAHNAFSDELALHREDGMSNILNQRYKEQGDTSAKFLSNQEKEFQGSKKFSLFGDYTQGYRQATGRENTNAQTLAETQGQLQVAQTYKQAIERVIVAQELAQAQATTPEGKATFTPHIEDSKKKLDAVNKSIGEFGGRIENLTATFMAGVKAVSDDGVLAQFEKLNPGFTQVRQQLESHLAGTLDGITNVIGDFVANGFSAVKDLQAISSALQNTAQAEGNYQSTVSNRANLMYSIEASPSFAKESQAVQTLIIEQATTAQKAAEAAAAQQVAIAKAQQSQVERENSLGGQMQKFVSDSTKEITSTLLKDAMGEGIKGMLGSALGLEKTQTNQYDALGNLKVVDMSAGSATPQIAGDVSPTSQSMMSKAYDWAANGVSGVYSSITSAFSSPTLSTTSPDTNNSVAAESMKALGAAAQSATAQVSGLGGGADNSSQLIGGMTDGLNVAFASSKLATEMGAGATEMDTQALNAHTAALMRGSASVGTGSGGGSGVGAIGAATKGTGLGANMATAGAALSIGTSLFSIGTTIASYLDSSDAYDAVIAAATAHNNDKPVVPTSDPTKSTAESTDTQYKGLAGYLSQEKYKHVLDRATSVLAAGALVQNTVNPAQFIQGSPVSPKNSVSGLTAHSTITNGLASKTPAVEPPQVNLKVVNVTDQSVVHDAMQSAGAEKIYMNYIQHNAGAIKEILR